jgi:prolyl 4-hydroxylase
MLNRSRRRELDLFFPSPNLFFFFSSPPPTHPNAVQEEWRGRVNPVSWSPRAFVFEGFLTTQETDHLIALATPKMANSTVVDNETGESFASEVRTSTGMFLDPAQDAVVARIERRLSLITHLPAANGEGIQILAYKDGQKYTPHFDYFHDDLNSQEESGGQRIATVLMYLSTPEEGGETVFPSAAVKVAGAGWSECARDGFAVKPRKGDALLFYSLLPDGTKDLASLHGSCPVTKGQKWSATKWIHVNKFVPPGEVARLRAAREAGGGGANGGCSDASSNCKAWASTGECSKNPSYMLISCPRACGQCKDKEKEKEEAVEVPPALEGGGAADAVA